MDIKEFWLLMEATHVISGADTNIQARLLIKDLAALGPQAVLAFEDTFYRFIDQAYQQWDSPGSALSRTNGFSDDGLEYFTNALIAAGDSTYYKALGASCPIEIENIHASLGWGEEIGWVPRYAYYRATGLPHPHFGEGDYDEDSIYLLVEDAPASPICDEVAA